MAYRITLRFSHPAHLAKLIADTQFHGAVVRANGTYTTDELSLRDDVKNNDEATARWLALELVAGHSLRILNTEITGVDLQRVTTLAFFSRVAANYIVAKKWDGLCEVVNVTEED
jgi:hypothetical protein